MAADIMKYFRPVQKNTSRSELPDPSGPLSETILSSTISSVNASISSVIADEPEGGTLARGPLLHLTPAQKNQVGKRAAEFGVTNTLRYYKKEFPKPCPEGNFCTKIQELLPVRFEMAMQQWYK